MHMPPPVDEAWWSALLAEEERYAAADPVQAAAKAPPSSKAAPAPEKQEAVNWNQAENLYLQDETICLPVTGYNRGGLLVEGEGICGFVPISHLTDVDPDLPDAQRDAVLSTYEGTTLCLKIIECCPERGRVVLSQRAAQAGAGKRNVLFGSLKPGDRVRGVVTNVTDFGVFIDLGGIEGLVHVSELSWGRVRHPGDIVQVGRQLETVIINLDRQRGRVALSLKRLCPNPWEGAEKNYVPGQLCEATITSIVAFGAFARLEEGLDGLIHASALSENGDACDPRQVLAEGQQVRVRVLHVDARKQRLGLSLCE
jgi:small subunit ribosomal protein S1